MRMVITDGRSKATRKWLWEDYVLKNILSISALEWLLCRVNCKIYRIKNFDASESRSSVAEL